MEYNKRATPRFLFSEPVAYAQPEVAINGSLAGNISLGGISLRVQEFVAVGTILELQIRLEQPSKLIMAKAQVVRVREFADECYEIGLKFIRDEECIKAVGEYIHACRSNQGS